MFIVTTHLKIKYMFFIFKDMLPHLTSTSINVKGIAYGVHS